MNSSKQLQEESFKQLPVYLHNLEIANPCSFTDIKKDGNERFQLCFVSLGCVMHSFLSAMLPVIVVCSAPLKGNCLTTMFTAIGLDGNHQPLPLAYGFGIRENSISWNWFLRRLRMCLQDSREVGFISKLSTMIESAIANVFPNSYRGYCCHNMFMKLTSRCRNAINHETLFWLACKSYNIQQFQENYQRLKHAIPSQAGWLDSVGHAKWARSFYPGTRYNVVSVHSYIPDALSLLLMDEENVPITTLIEAVRETLEVTFNDRRQFVGGINDPVTPYANTVFQRRKIKAEGCQSRHIHDLQYEVTDNDNVYTLDYRTHICSCGKWRTSRIPCRHAIATSQKIGQPKHDDFDQYFLTDVYRATYGQELVHPLPHPNEWKIPNFTVVLAPTTI